MPVQRKIHKKADGITYKFCGGECGQELPVTDFGSFMRPGGKIYYEKRCRVCKSKFNKAVRLSSQKEARKELETLRKQLQSVHNELLKWEPVVFFVRQNSLMTGFKSPQGFVLASLKTVYDNGRKTSKTELLRPGEGGGQIPPAGGDVREKPLHICQPMEQKPF